MDADLFLLLRATLALTVACALVLCLRRPARVLWGVQGAYLLWACVPAALLAALLPASQAMHVPVPVPAEWLAPAEPAESAASVQAAGFPWQAWLLPAWLAGALASAGAMAWQQWRFRRALGALREYGHGLFQAGSSCPGLPAVVGVLRPRILLPADFEQRYSERERELVLQHERLHVRRGDLLANAAAALLRCLFWFHPLLPAALRRFRHDQELACDAGVIARHPGQRRAYAEAMLKAQLSPSSPVPLGCHWPHRHPLKERIEMLKRPVSSPRQRIAAVLSVSLLAAGTACVAWAAQPARSAAPTQAPSASDAPAAVSDTQASPAPTPGRSMVPPRYPREAAEAGVTGLVTLLLDVDREGKVVGVEVERAEPAGVFEVAAIEAAWQWRLEPRVEDEPGVAYRTRVPIHFAIDQPQADEGGES